MAYFSNGTEGTDYQNRYCDQCLHMVEIGEQMTSCPILELHLHFNYEHCNKPDSLLHFAIPRNEDGTNAECIFYAKKGA